MGGPRGKNIMYLNDPTLIGHMWRVVNGLDNVLLKKNF